MKVLVIPDVHLKPRIFYRASAIMHQGMADRAVCLMDIADDWGQEYNIDLYVETYDAAIAFAKEYPDTLWCYGNHDLSYVWYMPETGYSSMAMSTVQRKLIDLKVALPENNPIKYVQRIDNVLFSHGGVSDYFVREYVPASKYNDIDTVKPSKSLQDSIKSMIEGNQEFIMLDDQKVVYEEILSNAIRCMTDQKKRTVIVKGGPGTGKTVVAINLLAKLTQEGYFAQYTSKNSAPRNVYAKKLTGFKKSSVSNMFKGSGSYTEVDENVIDVIICDEAHRLNEKSGLFSNLGENQVKEIISSCLCSVFFIDESQRVTLSDIGTVDEIKRWASELDSEILELELVSQFRCNGSDGYLAWLDDVLEIRDTANTDMKDIDYEIRIVDSPNEVRNLILERNKVANHSRILAGYCWEWLKDGKNNSEIHDICIDDFEMSWNLGNSTTFAIDENSVNEVGCIHTSQGLEFDYVGVIIGDDMRYEDEHIVTDFTKRAKTDQSLKGIKKIYKENPEFALSEADEIIKNTYRTLMTRGMKGCYVYCTDKKLAEHLRKCLE